MCPRAGILLALGWFLGPHTPWTECKLLTVVMRVQEQTRTEASKCVLTGVSHHLPPARTWGLVCVWDNIQL